MRNQILNTKSLMFLFVIVLLTYGVQGISYGQAAPTVLPGDDDTSLYFEFPDRWDFGDFREAYYFQVRKKTPQSPWTSKCADFRPPRLVPGQSATGFVPATITGLDPGTTYQVRYNNNTGEFSCSAFTRVSGPWSEIGEGTTSGEARQPDLVVEQPTVSKSTLTPGENFTLSATVRNQGTGSAAATTLRYYRSTDARISSSDTEVGTDSVSSLSANRTGDESIRLTAPTSAGTYYYGACVDSVDDEDNTANNCSDAVQITVEPPPESDLVVEQPSVSKSTLTPGENFTLSVTVSNQDAGSAAATTLRYYRSTDATISTSDTEVGTDSVSRLGANESGAESITLTAPTSAGTYYYGACVEAVTDESRSDNNCSAAVSITVRQPTLSASTTSPLIETTLDGSGVTLTLIDATYEQDISNIRDAVTVSGIAGVTVGMVRRESETEVTVKKKPCFRWHRL